MMMQSQTLLGLFWLSLAGAQELPPVSGLPHAVVLRRIPAVDRWDLVVALSSAAPCQPAPRPCWWNTGDRLGILLQDRGDPRDGIAALRGDRVFSFFVDRTAAGQYRIAAR
ncbi:MAG: hypothetical protein WDO73_36160 [Ignavibacteriota bacterium]